MGKVIVINGLTLDGVMQGPGRLHETALSTAAGRSRTPTRLWSPPGRIGVFCPGR